MRVFITSDCLRITDTLVSSSSGTVTCLSGGWGGGGCCSISWDKFGGIYSTHLCLFTMWRVLFGNTESFPLSF